MPDRHSMLYLLHAERRLLDQVYLRRHYPLGLSQEAALQWTQQEPERIQRLLDQQILLTEGEALRLSPLIQQFWEQWDEQGSGAYTLANLREEWGVFRAAVLDATEMPDYRRWIQPLRYWQKQLMIWLDTLGGQAGLQALCQEMEVALRAYTRLRLGMDQDLDRELIYLLEQLQQTRPDPQAQLLPSPLALQVVRLQKLRERDLLFRESGLEKKMNAAKALLWEDGPDWSTWPAIE